jgi:putative phosphoesterase
MKIAFISDVHGNQHALERVINSQDFKQCKKKFFCGDIFGYFYSGKKILKILQENCDYMIRGNHDDFLLKVSENLMDEDISQKYGFSHNRALCDLSTEDLLFIKSLPLNIQISFDGIKFSISHGMPDDNTEYFYKNFQDEQLTRLLSIDAMVHIFGHTHHQMHLQKYGRIIVNPGSVGQPRSGKQGAQWCIFDTNSLEVAFKTQYYDIIPVLDTISETDGQIKTYLVNKWESLS